MRKPQNVSADFNEDIPEALRDITVAKTRPRIKLIFLIAGLLGLGVVAASGLWYVAFAPHSSPINSFSPSPPSSRSSNGQSAQREEIPHAAVLPSSLPPSANPVAKEDTLLGHFAYPEAPASELEPIVADASIKMRKPAAKQFQAMVAAARATGVVLVPISGFRSIAYQQHVFFDIKNERGQTATKRAEVSAPPGYSEHHTGYAVDIGDGAVPAMNLNPNFDKTRAFKWLQANAAGFSFEISFPKNNPQGVSYEPWHWRFVGDRDSLETFYKAKNLNLLKAAGADINRSK